MKLSLSRYRSVLLVQISLLIVDLLINTFCEYLRFESVILLVVFVIQDVCLVFSLIIVFLSFFSTYIFQAGLVGVLVQQFRTPILVTVVYIGKITHNLSYQYTNKYKWYSRTRPFTLIFITIWIRSFYCISRMESACAMVEPYVLLVDRWFGGIVCHTTIYLCTVLLLLQENGLENHWSKILWRLILGTKWMGKIAQVLLFET